MGNSESKTSEEHSSSANQETSMPEMSYLYLMKHGYSDLVNLVIRPPRASYEIEELGPETFYFRNRLFQRRDFTLENDRKLTLQCSHWQPHPDHRPQDKLPCLIYLHGNSSCRVEALHVLRVGLASGMTVFSFDFAGCGQSEGEYISLGYYERDDLQTITNYLRSTGKISTIGLWGRSMGAATALLHADRDPTIAGIVLDRAFSNLELLAKEIVEQGRQLGYTIPHFLVKLAMKMIRSSVQKRAGFDIRDLTPIDHAEISFLPALFVAAEGDEFIAPHHSRDIHEKYAGDKNLITVDGDHNSRRPQFLFDSASIFLQTALQVKSHIQPDPHLPDGFLSIVPPWIKSSFPSEQEDEMKIALRESLQHHGSLIDFGEVSDEVPDIAQSPEDEWACTRCTYVNHPRISQCLMCDAYYLGGPNPSPCNEERDGYSGELGLEDDLENIELVEETCAFPESGSDTFKTKLEP